MKPAELLYGSSLRGSGPRQLTVAEQRLEQAIKIVSLAGFHYKSTEGIASCGADLLHLKDKPIIDQASDLYRSEQQADLRPPYSLGIKAIPTNKDENIRQTSEKMALAYLDGSLPERQAVIEALSSLFHLGQAIGLFEARTTLLITSTYLADLNSWK